MHEEYITLLGGSFNPLHIGHMRIALEVREALEPKRTFFIPTATPPHKTGHNLLPFDFRVSLLRAALQPFPSMEVCPIEGERSGPSYTVHTLQALELAYPRARFGFILGGEDFSLLHTWHAWQTLPDLADLIVLPRGGAGVQDFEETVQRLWPGTAACQVPTHGGRAFSCAGGGRLLYLPQPCLDISSSLVRERFMHGKSLDFLVPSAVQQGLRENRALARTLWLRDK